MDVTRSSAWQWLAAHAASMAGMHMRELFAREPDRHPRLTIDTGDVFLDYSKNRVVDETLDLLREFARQAGLPQAIEALFRGDRINVTENRPALHCALRRTGGPPLLVDGTDVGVAVAGVHARMREAVAGLESGRHRGATGARFTDVVLIGIGGSYLGPLLACRALEHRRRSALRLHFVANLDAWDLATVVAPLTAATTLFIVASKSFTTQETFTNAASARRWLEDGLPAGADAGLHFWALTANPAAALRFGIAPGRTLEFWEWVGGRYSLWSAIGLPLAILLGMEGYEALLAGAERMDRHFRETPFEDNAPVTLGLLSIWYTNFLGAHSHAVVPYDQRLALLPEYLQQLDMESNGKRVTLSGEPVGCATAPVLWGGVGTNSQHAFFQLLHQGTRLVPVDFVAVLDPELKRPPHHDLLLANCFAQSRALMWGRTAAEARAELEAAGTVPAEVARLLPHRVFPGNVPSNTLLLPRLDAGGLGALIALYEHRTYVQGALWNINPFDQWGVELGKQMAKTIERDLEDGAAGDYDSSTAGLLARYRAVIRDP